MGNQQDNSVIHLGFNINDLKLIGQGHEGRVYLLSQNKVLKVFYTSESCKSQLDILLKGQTSIFFPDIFDYDKHAIIMEYIDGSTFSHYLRKNNLNKKLSLELVKLIDVFRNLNFTRLDIRLAHIFVQADETIKIIDPRGSFEIIQPYPLLMLRGLQRHEVLGDFFDNIRYSYPDYYSYWSSKVL